MLEYARLRNTCMETAKYPEKTCREPVFNQHGMGYTCDLVLLHPGPCASFSARDSVDRRDRWESDHPDWRESVGTIDDVI
jgi:hypothetical protein